MSTSPPRAVRAAGLFRELWAPEVSGEDLEAVLDERRRRNLGRLVPLLAVMTLVHVVHVLVFLLGSQGTSHPSHAEWHHRILVTHAVFAVLALPGLVLARSARVSEPCGGRGLAELYALAYLLFGAVLAAFDQAVTVAVTPFIGTTIGVAVTLRASPRATVALQALGLIVFAAGQGLSQPNEEVRLSNLVNGSSFVAFAVIVGVVLTRAERREVIQQRLILRQKQELEEALARVQELAQRAESANRAKGTFLGSMSHEIRTPLNAILGITSLLEDELEDPRQRAWLETVQQSGRTLLALLEDLLVMSRLEAQRVELRPGPCDPGALVRQVCAAFEPAVREKGLQLEVDVGAELPRSVTADDVRLRQIVFNLVGNAIKFTDRGHVSVRAHAKPSIDAGRVALELEVEDTGRGVAPDERDRIFEPFVQGRRDKSETKPDGTGLGLAISQRLVALMGGHIALDSTLGKGSRFTVVLPELERRGA